jgi:drug/metabolite transporter (DMT)-like permease
MFIIKNKFVQIFAANVLFSFTGVMAKFAGFDGFGSVRFFVFFGLQLFMLGLYALFWQQIIKNFSLIAATASKGIMVILNLLWAVFIFNESVSFFNILGAAIIITGIYIVATGEVDNV